MAREQEKQRRLGMVEHESYDGKNPRTAFEIGKAAQRLADATLQKRKIEEDFEREQREKEDNAQDDGLLDDVAIFRDNGPVPTLDEVVQMLEERHRLVEAGVVLDDDVPPNSLLALDAHNVEPRKLLKQQPLPILSNPEVVVLFSKPLIGDIITVEYAWRIRLLIRYLMEGSIFPSLICFSGGVAPGNHLSSANAGYMYFKQLCHAQEISLERTSIFVDSTNHTNEGSILQNVVNHVGRNFLMDWVTNSTDEEELGGESGFKQKKIQLFFHFISTDYHLCSLNDLHTRSNSRSFLRPLLLLQTKKIITRFLLQGRENAHLSWAEKQEMPSIARLDVKWIYHHTPNPYVDNDDEVSDFLAKCFVQGYRLKPLLINLQGALVGDEQLHKVNYVTLSASRRILVAMVEDLYLARQPLLEKLRQAKIDHTPEDSLILAIENVVLMLGRCMDIIRPGGPTTGTARQKAFAVALNFLNIALNQLYSFFDPDQPIGPRDWGTMG